MIYPRPIKNVNECIATCSWRKTGWSFSVKNRLKFKYKKKEWSASRLAFNLNNHKIPRKPASLKKGLVLHTCDNGWCVNPNHLYYGTSKQNINDMFSRSKTVRKRLSDLWTDERIKKQQLLMIGTTASAISKEKMSKAHTGKILPENVKRKISQALKGKKFSRNHIISMRRSWTKKRREEVAKFHKGRKRPERTKSAMKSWWTEERRLALSKRMQGNSHWRGK